MANAKPIKILAIDGGGIRGVVPAMILYRLEQSLNKPLAEVFDLIAGTSTGGIIGLALTKPNQEGTTQMGSPHEALEIYRERGHKIFRQPLTNFGRFLKATWAVIRNEKYDASALEHELQAYFQHAASGSIPLKDATTPIIVPTYDLETRETRFFKSRNIHTDGQVPMWMVARATSAAPTFFEPMPFDPADYYPIPDAPHETDLEYKHGTLVDGGVMANNPAMCAYVEMLKHGGTYIGDDFTRQRPMIVVSIGTGDTPITFNHRQVKDWGQLDWARKIMSDMFINSTMDTVHYQMEQIIKARKEDEFLEFGTPISDYFRFQPNLRQYRGMDDPSEEHLQLLVDAALNEIKIRRREFERMIRVLKLAEEADEA